MRWAGWTLLIILLVGCGAPEETAWQEPAVSDETTPTIVPDSKVESEPVRFYEDEDLVSARKKVDKLLREGNAMWLLHGEATDNPAMCFLVLRRNWKSFTTKERAALRPIIEEQIVDLRANPAKYTATRQGAPLWDFVISKIQNAHPEVVLSDRKLGRNDFELSEFVSNFDAQPIADQEEPPKPVVEKDTRGLDQQLMSAISGDNVSAVRRLLKEGASANASWDSNGMPALTAAAVGGNRQIVKLLVENGANVNRTDATFGWTALQFAQNELQNERDNPGKYEAVIRFLESR